MPVHVAILRQVRPGREAEFRAALREFFGASFDHAAVLGAHLVEPAPGSGSREFGILRTFHDAAERDRFYESPLYRDWERRAREFTEGEPVWRELHGLEAWFRSGPQPPPPRWKMALLTFVGVYPLTSVLPRLFVGWLPAWPVLLVNVLTTAVIVAALTWAIMPLLVRLARPWLKPASVVKS